MRRLARVVAAVLVVLLGAIALAAVALGLWNRAQLRALAALATAERIPVAAPLVRLVTDAPRREEAIVVGSPTTIFRPGEGRGPWWAVVFVNGATRAGRFNPKVVRLGEGLSRAGYLVAIPDLPGLRLGQVTPRTTDALIRVVRAVARRRDAVDGQVSLYGVSVGATLALLASESPSLAGRVWAVGGEAPWTNLKEMIRLATTGLYGDRPYRSDPYLRLAVARSLAASLPSGRDRARLLGRLDAVPDHDPNPLAALRTATGLGAGGRSLVDLLLNRRPDRFARLYARLPAHVRAGVELLSPLRGARRLEVPVELASAPHDKYFPPAESRALVSRTRRARLTITSTLEHAVPHLSLGDLGDLLRFDEFIVRFLADTARRPR